MSADFPTTANAFQPTLSSYQPGGFVTKLALRPNPTITASVIPTPNAGGWNNSAATVTFTCTPGPVLVQTCSPPVMVRKEGANQSFSGTVVDATNSTASTTETVSLDMTPPVVAITSPSDSSSVSTGTLLVSGSITDALSGPGGVNCHGTQAIVNGSTFSCAVQLASGSNSITVIGTDLAGNAASANVTVTNTGGSGQGSPPIVSAVSPNLGGVGSVVNLTGTSFGSAQNSSVVMFNGIMAPILGWSDSNISVSVPVALRPGAATILVGVNGAASNVAQFTVTQPLFVTPSQLTMLVGNTQSMQLLDENGMALTGVTWTVDRSSIAQVLPQSNGQPVALQAKAAGVANLIGSYGSRSGTTSVTVLAADSQIPIGAIIWDVPSLGSYGISESVQSVRVDENTPNLYFEDDGAYGGNGAIRAIKADGSPKWIWPATPLARYPLLLAADNQGGAIYFASLDAPNQYQSWCYVGRVDEYGTESWEYQETNCSEDHAIGPDGTIYLLEDDFQNTATNVITALDPVTGQIKFTVSLPGFDVFAGGADYTMLPVPNDPNSLQPYCTPGTSIPPGATSTNAQTFEHGNMSVASDGTIYIPLTGGTTFFEGEPCDSTPADPQAPTGYTHIVSLNGGSSSTRTESLYLMAVKPDGSYTVQTVDQRSITGPGWYGSSQYSVFLQRPVPDGQGGVFIPVEQTLFHTGGSGGNVALPFTVQPDDLVLGSDGTAYVTGLDPNSNSGYVAAVDSVGGIIKWTASPGSSPKPSTIMSDDSLSFQYSLAGGSFMHLANATSSGQLSPLFASPEDGSDVGPVIPVTYGSRLPSELILGGWLAYQPDLSLSLVAGKFGPLPDSEHAESAGNPQKQNSPPLCHIKHCALVPITNLNPSSFPYFERDVTYGVYSLTSGTLTPLYQQRRGFTITVHEDPDPQGPPLDPRATICNKDFNHGLDGCVNTSDQDAQGIYTDAYSVQTGPPLAVIQTFFVDRGQVRVFWPSNAYSDGSPWYGALRQRAVATAKTVNIIPMNADTHTPMSTCTKVSGAPCDKTPPY